MALSRNNASHEVDAAPRVVDGGDGRNNDRLFEWLEAQMALSSNLLDPQESQGSNNVPPDVTPEANNINNPESHGSNDINSNNNMVNVTNYTSATSQENHVDSTTTHVTLNRDSPLVSPFNQFSSDCDDDDDDDWIAEVIESGILDICERGR